VLPSETPQRITRAYPPPFGRPALQDEVLAFHIAEGPQALHERSEEGVDRIGPGHHGKPGTW
jgi:hypothetical protein